MSKMYAVVISLLVVAAMMALFVGIKIPSMQQQKICQEEWECGAWSTCVNNVMHRACIDKNSCGIETKKPAEAKSCRQKLELPACGDLVCDPAESCESCIIDCGACPEPNVTVSVGSLERLFNSATDHCGNTLIEGPDIPVRALKNYLGEIVLISGNAPNNYAMFGTTFNNLRRNCSRPIFVSGDKWSITDFAPQQWLNGIHTDNGEDVYGLVHNEYHDPYAPNCKPGETTPANLCWYNFITAAKSTDGGRTFAQLPGAQKVVAILPEQWDPAHPRSRLTYNQTIRPDPQGYFSPTFIKKDSYYYSTFQSIPVSGKKRGVCIMRTQTPDDPHSWKIWDGNGFTIAYYNPYPSETSAPEQYQCAFISSEMLLDGSGPITYNAYLEKYMMVMAGIYEWQGRGDTCGIWYSLSGDLIHWEKPKLIIKTKLDFYPGCEPTNFKGIYPSIIDHDSNDMSFETAGQTPYLYYVVGGDPATGSFSILERRKLTFIKEEN